MSPLIGCLLVAAGGFAGSVSRYLVAQQAGKYWPSSVPWGTLFVNLTGSFLLGLLYGAHASPVFLLLIGTGFIGAYTTFSTFIHENMKFEHNKEWVLFIFYTGISLTTGIVFAYLGKLAGHAIG